MYDAEDNKDEFSKKIDEEKSLLDLDETIAEKIDEDKQDSFNKDDLDESIIVHKINGQELYTKFKNYYYDLSHSKYYGVMALVEGNRDAKKKLRDELVCVQRLRTIPVLRNEDREEADRINEIIDSLEKEETLENNFDSGKINELIVDIESRLKMLKNYIR